MQEVLKSTGKSGVEDAIRVENLTLAYDSYTVMKDLNFSVKKGEVFVIMGGSGCGKSTLLRNLIGLREPAEGKIFYSGKDFTAASREEKDAMLRNFGVLYQGGALWSSMTLSENVALPIYPSEISGGMAKRAGLARAIALDPSVLFFDEPSAGLDPVSSYRLDQLILQMRSSLGATVVVVTHELSSIFAIADRAIFLDANTKTQVAVGSPKELLEGPNETVRIFLNRGVDPLAKR